MRTMNRVALVASTVLVLAGCSGGDDDDGSGRCRVARPTSSGPGDTQGYFPTAIGDRWNYDDTYGAITDRVRVEVTGERAVDGIVARVFTSTLLESFEPPAEELVCNGPSGASTHLPGPDPMLGEAYPYLFLRWPLTPGDAYAAVSCAGLDAGEDLDGDGRREQLDLSVNVSVAGDEAVDVPAGSFTARKVSGVTHLVIRATSGQSAEGFFYEDRWYAPGVGLVRADLSTGGDVYPETEERVLVGYDVGGVAAGLQEQRTLATDFGGGIGDPIPHAIARLGDRNLLVGVVGSTSFAQDRLSGRTLDPAGATTATVDVGGWRGYGLRPAVAASGQAFLVTSVVCTTYCDVLRATRIGRDGAALDQAPGTLVAGSEGSGLDFYPPSVASNGTGWFVAWATYGGPTYAARIGADGAVIGSAIPLSTGETGLPAVSYAGGSYLVAFANARENASTISAVRVSPEGTVLDATPIVITSSAGPKWLGGATSDGTQHLVVWRDSRSGGTTPIGYPADDVYAARVSADGALLDGPPATGGIPVSTLPGQAKTDPRAAFEGARFVVTWWIDGYWSPAGAYAARLGTDGLLVDGPADGGGLLLAAASSSGVRARFPLAAPAANGETLATWFEDGVGVVGGWYAW